VTKLIRIPKDLPAGLSASAVTIGNFDGLHCGHQRILSRLAEEAKKRSLPSAVVTFRPHPAKLLGRHEEHPLIYPYEERYRLLEDFGAEVVAVQNFTRRVSQTPPEKWASDLLVEGLKARYVVVGHDFRFGRKGEGDFETLVRCGLRHGFEVEQVPAAMSHGRPISSSRIRRLIRAGEIAIATDLLGRPFFLRGVVGKGRGRGRELGFPTANLSTKWEMIPAHGVYACLAVMDGTRFIAAVNIGVNPTFGGTEPSVEVHLAGASGDFNGREITIHLLRRLRGERKFDSPKDLVSRIEKDVARTKQIVSRKMDIEIL